MTDEAIRKEFEAWALENGHAYRDHNGFWLFPEWGSGMVLYRGFHAGLSRRTPEPVGHEARRRSYQEGHRDGTEEACKIVYGMANSDNVAERTVQAIRALATKPAQEGDHV